MLFSLKLSSLWLLLLISWFVSGVIATAAGFGGFFYQSLSLLLIAPVILFGAIIFRCFNRVRDLKRSEKIIIGILSVWWLLHFIQVFTPETGFDAVWYHLPLAEQVTSSHIFTGTPEFYQSFNPQFSDSIFYLGYAAAGEIGTKLIAYFFGVTLLFSTYFLSRIVLNRPYALAVSVLVSSFQVVSWQSSSFYIDIAKAVWELSALVFILQSSEATKTGLAVGASLASKLFSVLLLPIFAMLVWINSGKRSVLPIILISVAVATPYYLFAYVSSGDAFYSLTHHLSILDNIGGGNTIIDYLVQRCISLPQAFVQMVFSREYTTPLVVLFFPLVIHFWKKIRHNKALLSLVMFSLFQLGMWWFLPPTSVRYALSGFITATIVTVYLLKELISSKSYQKWLLPLLIILSCVPLTIRLSVASRSWQYISGQQAKTEYLQQFFDGSIDQKLKSWHNLD